MPSGSHSWRKLTSAAETARITTVRTKVARLELISEDADLAEQGGQRGEERRAEGEQLPAALGLLRVGHFGLTHSPGDSRQAATARFYPA